MLKNEKLGWVRSAILVLLGIAGILSLIAGIRHGMEYGTHDFQWAGGHLVGQRIDPWQEELARFPHHFPHFVTPNYLHLLYFKFLLPFGLLSFHTAAILWTACSVCLSIVCVLMLQRLFRLDLFETWLALFLMWMCSPFRVVLEVGQMSFFELFFLTGTYFVASTTLGGLSFGVSLVKYSFSPAAAMLFLFRGRIRFLVFTVAVPLIGLIGVWLLVGTSLLKLAGEPFAVSALPTAVSAGFADLMTLAEYTLRPFASLARARQISYALGLFGSVAYAFLLSRFRLSRAMEFTLISVASLFFVKHLVYDYIFLVVLLCFALSQKKLKIKLPLIGGVLTFWFILPIFERRAQFDADIHVGQLAIDCLLLAALLGFTTYVVTAGIARPLKTEREEGEAIS